MLVALWRLCQDKETILPEACDGAVKLAVQRLKMYQEDAVVAHQVLKPPPKKKDKKSEEKKSEEGEWSFHITFGCESCTFLYVDHGSCHATGCNHLEFKVYSSGWQNFPISLYAIYIYILYVRFLYPCGRAWPWLPFPIQGLRVGDTNMLAKMATTKVQQFNRSNSGEKPGSQSC